MRRLQPGLAIITVGCVVAASPDAAPEQGAHGLGLLWSIKVDIANTGDGPEAARRAMAELAHAQRLSPKDESRAQVVIDEVLSNVIRHGLNPAIPSTIRLALAIQDGTLYLESVDRGRPFDPSREPAHAAGSNGAGAGRGLLMIHGLTRRIDYRREGDCNVLVLEQPLQDGIGEDEVTEPDAIGLRISETREDAVTIVHLEGRVDSATAPELTRYLTDIAGSRSAWIRIDMAGLAYVTSAGFRALLIAADRTEEAGGGLQLTGLSPQLRELFEMGGLLQAFDIVDDTS